ncbi:MAG: hypothetical protein ACQETO_02810 [Pseudomonadota bacterium]
MEPDRTAQGQGYDRIADRWVSDSFPDEKGIAQHERALAFVERKGRALDIGCGANGRFVDLLSLLGTFGCVCRHLEYDQYPEKHLYVIAQKS